MGLQPLDLYLPPYEGHTIEAVHQAEDQYIRVLDAARVEGFHTIMAKTKNTKATKPAPEVEVEVDEVEADEVEETATPAKEVAFGVSDIVALIKEKLGRDTTTRELRTLLRKMARDGRLNREIVAGNRARWEWSGPKDPEVKAIVAAFKAGELDADKKEKLDALKARKAEQKAAAAAAAAKAEKKSGKAAKAAPVEVEDDDEELEDDDED